MGIVQQPDYQGGRRSRMDGDWWICAGYRVYQPATGREVAIKVIFFRVLSHHPARRSVLVSRHHALGVFVQPAVLPQDLL